MKIFSKRHQKALQLRQKMEELEKYHLKHIEHNEKASKTKLYKGNKTLNDQQFLQREKQIEAKENALYTEYYNHMNKDFDCNNAKISFANKKYKDGFVDEKYINDMYKQQAKELAKKNKAKARTK